MPDLNASRIHSGLYQGAYPPGGSAVREAGFDVLVLCAEEKQDGLHDGRFSGVIVVGCPLDDDTDAEEIDPDAWSRACVTSSSVASLRQTGRRVLITCRMGLNRSGLITALTLHRLTGWSGAACVNVVRARRPGALFNESFVKALRSVR